MCSTAVSVQANFVTNLWGGPTAYFTRTSVSCTLWEASLGRRPFRSWGTTLVSAQKGRKSNRCLQVLGVVRAAGTRRGRKVRHGGARGKTGTAWRSTKIRAHHDRVQKEATGTWGPKDRRRPNVAASQGRRHEWWARVSDPMWPDQSQSLLCWVKVNDVGSGK